MAPGVTERQISTTNGEATIVAKVRAPEAPPEQPEQPEQVAEAVLDHLRGRVT
ncbi:MAG: hypothetical protein ACR2JF_04035 [Iamia sp.]